MRTSHSQFLTSLITEKKKQKQKRKDAKRFFGLIQIASQREMLSIVHLNKLRKKLREMS